MSVKTYADSRIGKRVDVDGQFGAQCWDLAADYSIIHGWTRAAMSTNGGPGDKHNGYASALWHHFDAVPARVKNYVRVPATEPMQPGDLAIWDFGTPGYPLSHVAVGLADAGSRVYVLTQNPEPTPTLRTLSKAGLLGYLRPRSLAAVAATPIPPYAKDEEDMFLIHVDGTQGPFQLIHLGTLLPVQTFPAGDKSVNKFAARFGNSIPVSKSEYDYYVTGKASGKVAA